MNYRTPEPIAGKEKNQGLEQIIFLKGSLILSDSHKIIYCFNARTTMIICPVDFGSN